MNDWKKPTKILDTRNCPCKGAILFYISSQLSPIEFGTVLRGNYSVLRFFAGFVKAAFAEWNIAVAPETITIVIAESAKAYTDNPAL